MIVVVGPAALRLVPSGVGRAAGTAPEIAAAAAADGATVEIVTKIGEDGAGEELLLALARARVGHLAVLRDPAGPTQLAVDEGEPPDEDVGLVPALLAEAEAEPARSPAADLRSAPILEPADIALALGYLRDYGVLVAVEPFPEGGAAVIAEAASFVDAGLVVIAPSGLPVPAAYAAATIIEAPGDDPEGAFAGLVGRYAAALDRGIAPEEAFRSVTAEGGWAVAGD